MGAVIRFPVERTAARQKERAVWRLWEAMARGLVYAPPNTRIRSQWFAMPRKRTVILLDKPRLNR